MQIIDQCVALGVLFAREYGGQLANRSFGGVQVSRTFYCRGQTGQQLLLGAYSALSWQIDRPGPDAPAHRDAGFDRRRRPRPWNRRAGSRDGNGPISHRGGRGVGHRRIQQHFFLSTNASGSNVTATYRAWKQGAAFANPCFTQIHPTAIPPSEAYQAKLTLMSESLRNDGRLWVRSRRGHPVPRADSRSGAGLLERRYPRFGNLAPRDLASRAVKHICDDGCGVGPGGLG